MSNFQAAHVVDAFRRAPNLNSAIKTFLKLQSNAADPKAVRFAKDLREAVQNGGTEKLARLVTTHFDSQRDVLLAIGACAHVELINDLISTIAEEYSDEFNSTYRLDSNSIEVTDSAKFEKIARDAFTKIASELRNADWEETSFISAAAATQLFEPLVLGELRKRRIA